MEQWTHINDFHGKDTVKCDDKSIHKVKYVLAEDSEIDKDTGHFVGVAAGSTEEIILPFDWPFSNFNQTYVTFLQMKAAGRKKGFMPVPPGKMAPSRNIWSDPCLPP